MAKAVEPSGSSDMVARRHDLPGETYKDKVKLTFVRGASLEDPSRLFNAGLDGGTRRAIDIPEGDEIDEAAFTALVREAVALNLSKGG